MSPTGRAASAVLAISLAFSAAAPACNVPVFRYALERWAADPYEIMVFHKGRLSDAAAATVAALRKAADSPESLASFAVRTFDIDGKLDDSARAIWQAQKNAVLPWAVLRYPDTPDDAPSAWSGPLLSPQLKYLLDSPARRQIASRLMKGDSVVWVLVECGDKDKDLAARRLLEEQLPRLEKEIELPRQDADDPDMQGPPLRSKLPLRLAFSKMFISRQAAEEAIFLSMLLCCEGASPPADQPALVPVFGRGRALGVLVGRQITRESMEDAAAFLSGPCSCQVKQLNPGVDILMAADWDALLEDATPREPRLPALPAGVR